VDPAAGVTLDPVEVRKRFSASPAQLLDPQSTHATLDTALAGETVAEGIIGAAQDDGVECFMIRQVYPWIIFVAFVSLLAFSATSAAKTIDWLLWPIRFRLIAGLSAFVVWSRWRHRNDERSANGGAKKDSADDFLSAFRRWYYGDAKNPK